MAIVVNARSSKVIPELKELDSLLRCGICYDFMKNTLITSCSHNYCSYCIRKFMQYKSQCPTCFKETTEPQLRNNRLVDQFIVLFRKVCEKVEDLTYERIQISDNTILRENNEVEDGTVTPRPKNEISGIKDDTPDITPARIRISVPDMFTPRRPKKPAPVFVEPVTLVPCPVCNVAIPERNINVHLDHCLAKSKEIPQERVSAEVDRRKPLPKLVYPLLQEKDLKKKLKDLGLSTLGDRKALVNRHQRYIVLYNSECDSLNPRPVSEIVDQVTNEEILEKKIAPSGNSFFPTNAWLTVDKKTDSKTIETAQKQYLNENKNSFTALIERIKKKKQEKEAPIVQGGEGPSSSTLGSSKVEDKESIEVTREKSLDSSGERSSSPEICTIPHEQGDGVRENNLQSSFDLFENSGTSPLRLSGQRNSPHQLHKQLGTPVKPGPSGIQVQSPFSPKKAKKYRFALSSPGPSRRVDFASGHSSLDSFPSTPPKLEEEFLLPGLNCGAVGSPDRLSTAGSTPSTPQRPSPLLCQFSPNLGAKYQPSDHERTPSPNEFGHVLLSSDIPSPPILRNKRRRIGVRSSLLTTHNEVEDDGDFTVCKSSKGMDLQLQHHLQDLKKPTKTGRKRGRRKK